MIRTIGSEKYGTEIMNDEEVVTFIEAAFPHNNGVMAEAFQDMKMIDNMLHMKRLHFIVKGSIQKTNAGRIRKGSDLYTAYQSVIEARVKNQL